MAVRVSELGFDCHECKEALKRERGCTEKGLVPFEIDGDMVFRCPISMVNPQSWEYTGCYGLYKKGIMPNGKGWINESRKYTDAMKVIDNELNTMEREQYNKMKRKRN